MTPEQKQRLEGLATPQPPVPPQQLEVMVEIGPKLKV
jgi:hypothetical protein